MFKWAKNWKLSPLPLLNALIHLLLSTAEISSVGVSVDIFWNDPLVHISIKWLSISTARFSIKIYQYFRAFIWKFSYSYTQLLSLYPGAVGVVGVRGLCGSIDDNPPSLTTLKAFSERAIVDPVENRTLLSNHIAVFCSICLNSVFVRPSSWST